MAIGHIAVRTHSRGRGHTAAAALAYRHGAAVTCPRTHVHNDFRRRVRDGSIAETGIYAPVPTPLADSLDALAAGIEGAERRYDARISRDVQIALPAELDEAARIELAEEFAQTIATRYRTIAAWAVHRPDDAGDARNHHAHILIPTRKLDEHGQLGEKLRQLDRKTESHREIKEIRTLWEQTANLALERAGVTARVDTGRNPEEPAPTLGPTRTAIERRARTRRGRRPRGVPVAALVSDGEAVTGSGRRLERHEHKQRSQRRRRRCERTDTNASDGPTLEELRAAPAPKAAPEPLNAPRTDVKRRSATPTPPQQPRPTPPAPTRAATAALPLPKAHPEPEPTPIALAGGLGLLLDRLRRLPALRRSLNALRARLAAAPHEPAPQHQPQRPELDNDALAAADPPPRYIQIMSEEEATAERVHMIRDEITDEVARARRQRGPRIQAHADTHGQAPTPEEARTIRKRLAPHFGECADSIAKLRFHPRTQAPPIVQDTAERLRHAKGCHTAEGAAAAAKPLDQALDQIARQVFAGALHPHEYRRTWFGRRLDDACNAASEAWAGIRDTVIERMVVAATGIEAIAQRERLEHKRRDRAKRDAEATARRRQMAAVRTQPARKPDSGRHRWD